MLPALFIVPSATAPVVSSREWLASCANVVMSSARPSTSATSSTALPPAFISSPMPLIVAFMSSTESGGMSTVSQSRLESLLSPPSTSSRLSSREPSSMTPASFSSSASSAMKARAPLLTSVAASRIHMGEACSPITIRLSTAPPTAMRVADFASVAG